MTVLPDTSASAVPARRRAHPPHANPAYLLDDAPPPLPWQYETGRLPPSRLNSPRTRPASTPSAPCAHTPSSSSNQLGFVWDGPHARLRRTLVLKHSEASPNFTLAANRSLNTAVRLGLRQLPARSTTHSRSANDGAHSRTERKRTPMCRELHGFSDLDGKPFPGTPSQEQLLGPRSCLASAGRVVPRPASPSEAFPRSPSAYGQAQASSGAEARSPDSLLDSAMSRSFGHAGPHCQSPTPSSTCFPGEPRDSWYSVSVPSYSSVSSIAR
ncbi:hypothetical protein AB1Y20_019330 [Prymnesium parvum]|uniref:Uncharacterized protein n=1 Tax=Prymnesium parvum TaxID=97485 RepID=A0AB34JSE1_PRYPA